MPMQRRHVTTFTTITNGRHHLRSPLTAPNDNGTPGYHNKTTWKEQRPGATSLFATWQPNEQ
ncbi:hypothetical protein K443DRAFT_7723 [Laccaria amethystina LaAM-08-1]|uniref:Uncharacterized protein n=1 Tax=Laccaria amethystina LaAM-08-1 TaxID=1095629 RepID=A0A0C9X5Q4_9AGAR|nr:hypothetical protein K443DRAFT_7723 [Laccaria amethystina LaAM-08-1]